MCYSQSLVKVLNRKTRSCATDRDRLQTESIETKSEVSVSDFTCNVTHMIHEVSLIK